MEIYFFSQRWHKIRFKSFSWASKNCASFPNMFKRIFKRQVFSEEGRLISDISGVSDWLKLKGLLLTVDIEKVFDSVNHNFLLKVLENYGFSDDFLKWISILLQNHESCIINGGKTMRYIPLKRGTWQGDPISPYLFILVLVFVFVKESENIQGLAIFNNQFLYTAYADDTNFFIGEENSVTEITQIFEDCSISSRLKPNKSKCKIAGIGVLKGVQTAL